MKIFDLRDTTNDEMFFPLGLFTNLMDIKAKLQELEESGEAATEYGMEYDYEEVTVVERETGWMGKEGKEVLKVNRERYYDEDKDDYLWRTVDS